MRMTLVFHSSNQNLTLGRLALIFHPTEAGCLCLIASEVPTER